MPLNLKSCYILVYVIQPLTKFFISPLKLNTVFLVNFLRMKDEILSFELLLALIFCEIYFSHCKQCRQVLKFLTTSTNFGYVSSHLTLHMQKVKETSWRQALAGSFSRAILGRFLSVCFYWFVYPKSLKSVFTSNI
mgnify:CR=1 FL=1